jgi:hypothetical protein
MTTLRDMTPCILVHICHTTRREAPQDSDLHRHCRHHLKSNGTWRYVNLHTRVRHLSSTWTRWFQSRPSWPLPLRYILILSKHLRLGHLTGHFTINYHEFLFIDEAWDRVVGWGTVLQTGRSQIRFPIRSLDLSVDLILSTATWPWCPISLEHKWVPGIFLGVKGGRSAGKADNLTTVCETV